MRLTRQPTMRRTKTSMMKATYSQPCQVETRAQARHPQLIGLLGLEPPLDRAACHPDTLTPHLRLDLVSAVDLPVGVPDTLDVGHEVVITLNTSTARLGMAPPGHMKPVTRRGHLQNFADGLDPEGLAVLVDETL